MDTAKKVINEIVQETAKAFKLEDVIPANSNWEVNGKAYVLRKVTLEDEVWLRAQGDLQKLFISEDLTFLSRFAFRQLMDKSDFLPVKEKGYDDDGNEVDRIVTGPQRLLKSLSGPTQRYDLIKTLCACIGISRPVFDQLVEDSLKKKDPMTEVTNPVGEKSST